jgi:hypothetical protein
MPSLKYRCCGRGLSDPVSIETGIGPIRAMKQKEEAAMDRNENLFGVRAEYSLFIDREVKLLALRDKDTGLTITNDVEAVVRHLATQFEDLDSWIVIYHLDPAHSMA